MLNAPACGFSLWTSHDYECWYPVIKFIATHAEAERLAAQWRATGTLVEVRVNQSLVW